MIKEQIEIQNEKGLHARAASKIVHVASKFKSKITLKKDNKISNAKSILGLLTLAACKGEKLELIIEGEDEQLAYETLINLFNKKFQEEN